MPVAVLMLVKANTPVSTTGSRNSITMMITAGFIRKDLNVLELIDASLRGGEHRVSETSASLTSSECCR